MLQIFKIKRFKVFIKISYWYTMNIYEVVQDIENAEDVGANNQLPRFQGSLFLIYSDFNKREHQSYMNCSNIFLIGSNGPTGVPFKYIDTKFMTI
jgi:hypothetical protein